MTVAKQPGSAAMLDASSLSRIAQTSFAGAPASIRWMQGYRPWICPFEELLPFVPDGARVLDVGCGAGLFLVLAAACGKKIHGTGFDSNPDAIAAAKAASQHSLCAGSVLEFECRRADEPWPSGEYDVVTLIDVLHHIPPRFRDDVVAAAGAKLAPRGILIYKDISARPRWMSYMNRLHDLVVAHEWVRYHSVDAVEKAAIGERLAPVRRWRPFRWWYSHEAVVLQKPTV